MPWLCCALAGCGGLVEPSVHDKEASWQKVAWSDVERARLTRFLRLNTTFVFPHAAGVRAVRRAEESGNFVVELDQDGGPVTGGLAAAVTFDGYHVTTKHVLPKAGPVLLVRGENGRLRQETARVVWRAPDRRDLAVIKGGLRLACLPMGADLLRPATVVVAAGATGGESTGVVFGVNGARVFHTAPLRRGDSGGPLLDSRGVLRGVNRATGIDPFRGRWNEAVLVDPAEIIAVVEQDRRRAAGVNPDLPNSHSARR